MRKLFWQIKTNQVFGRISKASIGVAPMLISFELGISMILGYFAARYIAGTKVKTRGRVPSFILNFRRYRLHLHHWLVFSNILVITLILHVFIITPYIFYGFLGGVIAQGLIYYDDWAEIITRR